MKLCILTNDYCCITLLIIASYVAKRFMKLKHAYIGRKTITTQFRNELTVYVCITAISQFAFTRFVSRTFDLPDCLGGI